MANFNIQEFIADDIIIDGDDLIIDGVTQPIKQKLIFGGLNYRRDLSKLIGNKGGLMPNFGAVQGLGNSTTITVYAMLYHANPDGSYGKRVESNFIREYETPLIANNTTWVDLSTNGVVIGNVGEEKDPANTQPALFDEAGNKIQEAGKFYGKTLMKEGEFYDFIAQTKQVNICDLIEQSMTINRHRCQPKNN